MPLPNNGGKITSWRSFAANVSKTRDQAYNPVCKTDRCTVHRQARHDVEYQFGITRDIGGAQNAFYWIFMTRSELIFHIYCIP
jgi:hypothetical protein